MPNRLTSFRSRVLPLLLLAVAAPRIRAAEALVENSCPPAAIALARYTAGQGEAGQWPVETMRIEASLPKLAKNGRLRAVRRLLPLGRPQYQVLETAGDATVKQQVIVRYLTADAKTIELPASSVAITPANYKFRYIGPVPLGEKLVYAFRITPRKKREGLMSGVLWLDRETGVAVRQSGYLVKSPSIFIKRVSVTRENYIHDGTIEARITHLAVDTRLVGRAELVIEERPAAAFESEAGPVSAAQ